MVDSKISDRALALRREIEPGYEPDDGDAFAYIDGDRPTLCVFEDGDWTSREIDVNTVNRLHGREIFVSAPVMTLPYPWLPIWQWQSDEDEQ